MDINLNLPILESEHDGNFGSLTDVGISYNGVNLVMIKISGSDRDYEIKIGQTLEIDKTDVTVEIAENRHLWIDTR